MAFRDDREAMRARLEAAEVELSRARQELAALRGDAPKGSASRDDVPPPPATIAARGAGGGGWLLLGFGALVVIGGMTVGFGARGPTHPGFTPTALVGVVTAARGLEGVTVGQGCTLRVSPVARGAYNCRLRLQCGARLVYGGGASGYTTCELDGGVAVSASDPRTTGEEGDPAVTLDRAQGALHLWDDTPGPVALDVSFPPLRAKAAP